MAEPWCSGRVSGLRLKGGRFKSSTLECQKVHGPMKCKSARAPPEICFPTLRPNSTKRPASISPGRPKPSNKQDRNTAPPISREAAKSNTKFTNTTRHTTQCSSAYQKYKSQPHPPEHRNQSHPTRSLHKPLNQTNPLGADTKNNRKY